MPLASIGITFESLSRKGCATVKMSLCHTYITGKAIFSDKNATARRKKSSKVQENGIKHPYFAEYCSSESCSHKRKPTSEIYPFGDCLAIFTLANVRLAQHCCIPHACESQIYDQIWLPWRRSNLPSKHQKGSISYTCLSTFTDVTKQGICVRYAGS